MAGSKHRGDACHRGAVATMSLGWNFEAERESVFWEAYGVVPDHDRIHYYRDLWDST